jgi:hypothetical protein
MHRIGIALIALALASCLDAQAAATGTTNQQYKTAAPVAVNLGGVAASEGASDAFCRASHSHSITGVLPVANGGTGASSGGVGPYVRLQSGAPSFQTGTAYVKTSSAATDFIKFEGVDTSSGGDAYLLVHGGDVVSYAEIGAGGGPGAGDGSSYVRVSPNGSATMSGCNGGCGVVTTDGSGVTLTGAVSTATVITYNGAATVGAGIPAVFGAYTSSADETASKGDTTLRATSTSPGAGMYRIAVYVMSNNTCATPGPGAVTVGVKWTDPSGVQKTIAAIPMDVNGSATLATSLPLGNTTGWANADFPIFASASTNIIFNTTLTACTAGTAKYRVYVGMDKPT